MGERFAVLGLASLTASESRPCRRYRSRCASSAYVAATAKAT